MAVHADIVNGDVDVFTSLIKFKYLLPNVQFYVNPVRLKATEEFLLSSVYGFGQNCDNFLTRFSNVDNLRTQVPSVRLVIGCAKISFSVYSEE